MKIKNTYTCSNTKLRQKQIPNEILGRLNSLQGNRNLREQRDTFSSALMHPCGIYRWNLPLFKLPYHHILETREYGEEILLHIYHPCTQRVVTLMMRKNHWICLGATPDDQLDELIADRCTKTHWLSYPASKGQRIAVKKITGDKVSPLITAANANVIIHTQNLMNHIIIIEKMLNDWIDTNTLLRTQIA